MPIRYLIMGVLSIIIGIALSEITGKYNQRVGEILSMDMVFIPVAFCIIVILEGAYQTMCWFYKKRK